jgi:uncharacterized membrane protein (UPF0127 family)
VIRRAVAPLVVLLALGAGCTSGDGADGEASGASVPSSSGAATSEVTTPSTLADGSLRAPVGLTAVVLTVTRPDGSTVEVCVWLADDGEERSVGLMDVGDPDLGGKAGMVFVYAEDVQGSFWMRDTLLPLSIAFVDADGEVVSSTDMEPCPAGVTDCPTYPPAGPYRMALEVPQGELPDLGVVDGSRLVLGGDCAAA